MKEVKINGKLGKYVVNFPEELNEISNEYLDSCTQFVEPNADYVLVAVVYKDSLNLVLTSARTKKPAQLNIIPVFVKAGKSDSEFINNLKLGDRIVISGSDLSIGNHINSPYNKITPGNIISITEGDTNIVKESLNFTKPVCFIEFKLVPANAVHAKLDNTTNNFVNPFIKKDIIDLGN